MVAPEMTMFRGEYLENVSLAKYTSWRVGGPADRLFRPADVDDLAAYLRSCPADEAITWIGLGSNLLVRDGGVRGSVILMLGSMDEMDFHDDDTVSVGAGLTCAKLARGSARNGYSGLEFLAGVPGTIGGALAMNAGAWGGETWEHIVRVQVMDRQGNVEWKEKNEFTIGYRSVKHDEEFWFVAAQVRLSRGDSVKSQETIKKYLAERAEKQPTGTASCGSVFRNPEGDHAGRLIESCGLKGRCFGHACVSEKHANFILNVGGSDASDIEELIYFVQREVKQKTGIELIAEVRMIGEAL